MEFTAKVIFENLVGEGINLDLILELYDPDEQCWRNASDIFKKANAPIRLVRRKGAHLFEAKSSPELDQLLANQTGRFRLTTEAITSGGIPRCFLMQYDTSISTNQYLVDFNHLLYLGEDKGFQILSGGQEQLCLGVPLPEDKGLAQRLREFYLEPERAVKLQSMLEDLQTKLASCEASNVQLQNDIDDIKIGNAYTEANLKNKITELEKTIEALNNQNTDKEQSNVLLNKEIAEKQGKIISLEFENQNLKQSTENLSQTIAKLEQSTDEKLASIRKLQADYEYQRVQGETLATKLSNLQNQMQSSVKTKDLFSHIGEDVGAAAHALKTAGMTHKIGKLDLKIRAIMSPDGQSLYLPNITTSISDTPLSDINIELIPEENVPLPRGQTVVPSLLGLTESAVRDILLPLGLKVQKSLSPVTSKREHDRAISQLPASDSVVEAGSSILVVYGHFSVRKSK